MRNALSALLVVWMGLTLFGDETAEKTHVRRPVARWDVVPYQRVSGIFTAGVVAFHESALDVTFAIGEETYVAHEPTYNERTGVWEYVCPIAVPNIPDGVFTVNATATTRDIEPAESFALPELTLYANAGGTLSCDSAVWADSANGDDGNAGTEVSPVKSLSAAAKLVANGGTIYLKAGSYAPKSMSHCGGKYWTTITPAPGVERADVEITYGRPGADRLLFKNLSLVCDCTNGYCTIIAGENGNTCCWIDGCKTFNKRGRWAANSNTFGNGMLSYVTGGETTDMMNGPGGSLVRDHYVYHIASDVWTGSARLVVNCRCNDISPGTTGAHPDFYQAYAASPGWVHDVILYNVRGYDCQCQGLFGVRLKDSAFVNVSIQHGGGMYSQWSDPMLNVLFAHVTLVGQTWLWRASSDGKSDFDPTDVRFLNGNLVKMGSYKPLDEFDGWLTVAHNAFCSSKEDSRFGTEAITIDRAYYDEANHVYAPVAESAALTNGIAIPTIPADIDGNPYPGGARPCGAWTDLTQPKGEKKVNKYIITLGASVFASIAASATDIGTAEEFVTQLAANPAGSYTLTADIDLTDSGFTTIPEFTGTLDGTGHTITGLGAKPLVGILTGTIEDLVIDGEVDGKVTKYTFPKDGIAGIFCQTNNAGTILRSTVKNYYLYGEGFYGCRIGLFAGVAINAATFNGCTTDATCTWKVNNSQNYHSAYGGGIVGEIKTSGTPERAANCISCTNNATGGFDHECYSGGGTGGIVGYINSVAYQCTICGCVNNGTISSSFKGSVMGGIWGTGGASADRKLLVVDCVNNGAITASAKNGGLWIGGLFGTCGSCLVLSNCVNRGEISCALGDSYAGGLGDNPSSEIAKNVVQRYYNCANYADVTAVTCAGGFNAYSRCNKDYGGTGIYYKNCANYGTITATTTDEFVPPCVESKATMYYARSNRKVDTAFAMTRNIEYFRDESEHPTNKWWFTVANTITAADEGYGAWKAKRALNELAKTNGYGEWVLGKLDDGRVVPELAIFCKRRYYFGLQILVR